MAGSKVRGNEGNEGGTDGQAFCVVAEDDNFEARPAAPPPMAIASKPCPPSAPSSTRTTATPRGRAQRPAPAIVTAIDAEDDDVEARPAATGQDARGLGGRADDSIEVRVIKSSTQTKGPHSSWLAAKGSGNVG